MYRLFCWLLPFFNMIKDNRKYGLYFYFDYKMHLISASNWLNHRTISSFSFLFARVYTFVWWRHQPIEMTGWVLGLRYIHMHRNHVAHFANDKKKPIYSSSAHWYVDNLIGIWNKNHSFCTMPVWSNCEAKTSLLVEICVKSTYFTANHVKCKARCFQTIEIITHLHFLFWLIN